MRIAFVVAMDKQGLIGKQNQLPWHLSADLRHFKQLTLDKPVIMGRKTFESIGKPLPHRKNIIISRNKAYQVKDAYVVHSLEEALTEAMNQNVKSEKTDLQEVMIIGGAKLFAEAFPLASRIYLTLIHQTFTGDTYFPRYDKNQWQEISREDHAADEKNSYNYSFIILDRK